MLMMSSSNVVTCSRVSGWCGSRGEVDSLAKTMCFNCIAFLFKTVSHILSRGTSEPPWKTRPVSKLSCKQLVRQAFEILFLVENNSFIFRLI